MKNIPSTDEKDTLSKEGVFFISIQNQNKAVLRHSNSPEDKLLIFYVKVSEIVRKVAKITNQNPCATITQTRDIIVEENRKTKQVFITAGNIKMFFLSLHLMSPYQ